MKQSLAGVYQITNQVNDKRYIGSSVDIERRWAAHRNMLRAGTHHSAHLQRAWNQSGEENFEFEVVCLCPRSRTIEFEQEFLDVRQPEYNIATSAEAPMGGRHHTNDVKRKMSESHKNRSVETQRKMSEALKGKIPWNKDRNLPPMPEETRKKISEANKGHIVSEETRRKISETLNGHIAWNKGKHPSAETKAKQSAAQKKRWQREKTTEALEKPAPAMA